VGNINTRDIEEGKCHARPAPPPFFPAHQIYQPAVPLCSGNNQPYSITFITHISQSTKAACKSRLNSERAFDEGIFEEALRAIQRYLQAVHKDLAAVGLPPPFPRPTEHVVQEEVARHPLAAQAVNRDRDALVLNPAQHLTFITVVAASQKRLCRHREQCSSWRGLVVQAKPLYTAGCSATSGPRARWCCLWRRQVLQQCFWKAAALATPVSSSQLTSPLHQPATSTRIVNWLISSEHVL
jgi:hypothetical protein